MINRFRIAMTLIEATKITVAGSLAYATQIDFQVNPVWAIVGTAVVLFLGVVSVQMPSWQSSGAVSKAATNAEKPDNDN